MPAVTSCYKDTPLRGIPQGRVFSLCLFYRRLDDGEPLVGILLIPDPVDVNGAGSSNNLVSAVFDGVALARFRAERQIVVTSPSGLTRFCSE